MNQFRLLALVVGVTLAANQVVVAQEKPEPGTPAIQKTEVKEGRATAQPQSNNQGAATSRFVSGDEVLNHGDAVTITRKGDGTKVSGNFVWADPKAGRLYIRPKAGEAPVAVPTDDVGKIERIALVGNAPDQSTVKPAVLTGDRAPIRSEIQSMEIFNGPFKSVAYNGPPLSAPERERLSALQKATNAVAEKGMLVQSLKRDIQNASTSDSSVNVYQSNPWVATFPYYAFPLYSYYYPWSYYGPYYYSSYPSSYFNPYFNYAYGLSYYSPYYYSYYVPYYSSFYPAFPTFWYGGGSTNVVVNTTGGEDATLKNLKKSLSEAQNSLAEAQKNYAAIQNRAIYAPNGQIVAVRMEE
jgi:hypothetical protein